MNVRERAELRRIVKERFKLLKTQIVSRQGQLRRAIELEALEESKATIHKAEKKINAWKDKVEQLNREGRKLAGELHSLDLELGGYGHKLRCEYQIGRVRPIGLEDKVQKRYYEVLSAAGATMTSLELTELDLLEKLALDGIETDDARAFLAEIPSIDTLIPLPKHAKQAAIEQEV